MFICSKYRSDNRSSPTCISRPPLYVYIYTHTDSINPSLFLLAC